MLRRQYNRTRLLLYALLAAWTAVVGVGLACLWIYAATPGDHGATPNRWPVESGMAPAADRPTLVVFAHPRCPCTRATIGELAKLMVYGQGRVDARVLFFTPRDAADDWRETDLWDAARQIPGVAVASDEEGVEAARFSVATSGHAVLYDPDGRLLFSGGLTAARGHSGDNPGSAAIEGLLAHAGTGMDRTPVFGCGLSGGNPQSRDGAQRCCPK
jgi:hypothetical protein